MTAIEKVGIGAACTKLEVRASEEIAGRRHVLLVKGNGRGTTFPQFFVRPMLSPVSTGRGSLAQARTGHA